MAGKLFLLLYTCVGIPYKYSLPTIKSAKNADMQMPELFVIQTAP